MDKIKIRPRGCEVLLIFVFLGLTVLAFFAYRHWKSPQDIASNERNVAGMLKMLASAQADFRANDRDQNGIQDFWTGDVVTLFRYGLIDWETADPDADPVLPEGPPVAYRGYYFVALKRDESETPPEALQQGADKTRHPSKFGFCAYPKKYGVTGRNTFILNQDNTIFWRHTDGEPMDHWPSDQDLRHEWGKGD